MHRPVFAILAAVLLTACASKPKGDVVLPMNPPAAAPAPAADAAPPPAAAPPAPASRQAPAARAARAPAPAPAPADEGPMTVTKAREQCWMKYESGKPISNAELDKKVKLVEKCVDERMNASIGR